MEIKESPHSNGTILEATFEGEHFWRIARTPEQIPKKRILLERDIELWTRTKLSKRQA